MLVLTRKSKEKISIGKKNKVVVTVLKVQGDQVSLGFEADRDTPIYRMELLEAIEAENEDGAIQKEEPVSSELKALASSLKLKQKQMKGKS